MSSKGFIYIASNARLFYNMAVNSAQSLKDCCPDANITLFTHENFLNKKADIFDNVVTNIPVHKRAKMWCCARTPYDSTVYLDSDTLVLEEDVIEMLDYNNDNDMSFQHLLVGSAGNVKWEYADVEFKHRLKYHGGLYTYNKTDLTIDFFNTWFDEYIKQTTGAWELHQYNEVNRQWDMLTLWRLFNEEEFSRFQNLKIGRIHDKYNQTPHSTHKGKPSIIHYPKTLFRDTDKTNEELSVSKSDRKTTSIIYK